MEWKLTISKNEDEYYAQIEINGQQTYIIIHAKVTGNEEKIQLVFHKGLDGTGYEQLKEGDLLFELIQDSDKIVTDWHTLTPRLMENFQDNTVCFRSIRKTAFKR